MPPSYQSHITEYWPSDCMVGSYIPLGLQEQEMQDNEAHRFTCAKHGSPQDQNNINDRPEQDWFNLLIISILVAISSFLFIAVSMKFAETWMIERHTSANHFTIPTYLDV